MQNPDVSQTRSASLQLKIAAVSEGLNALNLSENTEIMAFLRLVKRVYEEDQTENAKEWAILDAHLQTFLTTVIWPLERKREKDTADIAMKRINMFCKRWSEAAMDRSEPLSCGNLVANDYAANISGLNQQFDVSIRKSTDASFFSDAHTVDAKYSTLTAVAGDQHNVYNNSMAWVTLTFVLVFFLSLALQRTIVSSQTREQAVDGISIQEHHEVIEKLELQASVQGTEFSLKPAPAIFYGRQDLVDNITHLIVSGQTASDAAHIAIMGSGGMGKTSVALAVIHDPRAVDIFGDNRHWVPCDKVHTIPLFLEHLARMFAVTVKPGNPLGDIMSHLKENNVPRIILLDNFETLWDPVATRGSSEDIISLLGSISNITILLTMRGSMLPSGVLWTKLSRPEIDPLSLDAARDTFKRHNQYYIDDHLDDLLRAIDCWPLAITLVARVGHSSKMMPSELLVSWKEEKTALLNISPDRLESIDVSIRVSLRSLRSRQMDSNQGALTLLSVLACLPGGIMPEYLRRVAPAIQNIDGAKRALLGASLAEYTPDGALKVLSPIRAYMLQHHQLNASNMVALRMFYFQLVEAGKHDPGSREFRTAFESLRQEDSNIRSVLMDALSSEDEINVDAVKATIHYSHYLYWNVPSTEVLDKAIGLIRRHRSPKLDPHWLLKLGTLFRKDQSPELDSLMPHCLLRLGALFRRMDDFPQAVSSLNQAKKEFELHKDWGGAAKCCLQLASVYMMMTMHRDAINVLDTARDYFGKIGDLRGESDYLEVLGRVYRRQRDYTNAAAALVKSQAICTILQDDACVAIRAHVLGIIYRTQWELDEAIKAINKADAYFAKALVAPYYVAESIYNRGIVYYMQQRYNQSDAALAQAYNNFTILGNHGMMAWCIFHQGELNLMRGHLEQAGELFGKAKRKFENMGPGWTKPVVDCIMGETRVFAALHQIDNVRHSCSDAKAIIGDQEGYEENFLEMKQLGCIIYN